MLKMKVWSPGFSRRDVGNFDDCEMFKRAENVTSAPAKAGTPYLHLAKNGQSSTYWHFFDFGLPVSAFGFLSDFELRISDFP